MKFLSQLNKFLSPFYREKDDCRNTGCFNRNCTEEEHNVNKHFSWQEPTIFGERGLVDDVLKGKPIDLIVSDRISILERVNNNFILVLQSQCYMF